METYLEPQLLLSQLILLWKTFAKTLWCIDTAIAGGALLLSLVLAYAINRPLTPWLVRVSEKYNQQNPLWERFVTVFPPLIPCLLAVFFLMVCVQVVAYKDFDPLLITICSRLITAWVLIRFGTGMLKSYSWARMASMGIWSVAALHILGLLPALVNVLNQLAITIGDVHLSMLLVGKAVILLGLMLKGGGLIAGFTERRILSLPDISPSIQVLLSKVVKISLLFLAVIITLGVLGINLSAFAFIGGAIGVGLGFGLQKVVSNLVSGIILLLDHSIKPGDVIEVGSTYGRIKSLGARYVSVATRDNTEYLIPNEDLIVNQVVNWSFSNALIRLKILFPVAYDSDIHQVIDLILTTAVTVPRVLDSPKPSCQLKEFGDSSLNLELRLWIADPENGVSNIKSAVRIAVWDVFKANGVDVPFPQLDISMRPAQL